MAGADAIAFDGFESVQAERDARGVAPDELAGSASAPCAVEARGVGFSYDGETLALDGLDLSIKQGEFVCVLGGNGSGKSTFARHIDALLVPDKGTVKTCGHDTADPELVYDIRSAAGMVFQNPDDQIVATLVEADVAFGPENLGVPTAELAGRVRAALEQVGLVGFETRETYALSGGQKQRVAIAGVLAMEPQVLVLDEASAMLDPRGRAGLMKVCHELHDQGMTIVMITHFMEEAAEADRVVVLNKGAVALEGTPVEVFAHAQELADLNLEVPPAVELGLKLRAQGWDAPVLLGEAAEAQALAVQLGTGECAASAATDAATAADVPAVAEPLIQLQNVSYSYEPSVRERAKKRRRAGGKQAKWGNDPHEVWALQNIDLTVYKGEFLGIAGHTGSGKSTLIQHLNGLVNPTSGQVLLNGQSLADRAVAAQAKHLVGVVFQYPEHQLFAETVFDDVAFGPRNLGLGEDEVAERVRTALEQVGLDVDALGSKSPFEISGGQQRRVAFAGVLAMKPQVLVLDEPAAGLDPAARRSFLSLIESLHSKQGLTVVMVSHNMDDLASMADRVAVLNEGRIFAQGTPAQVFRSAAELKAVGLGLPSAQRMAVELARCGVPLSLQKLYGIDSLAAELTRLHAAGEVR